MINNIVKFLNKWVPKFLHNIHFLNNFEMSETDINGQLAWTLSGDKLEKFPNSLRSEVTMPIMNIKDRDNINIIRKLLNILTNDNIE